MSTPLPRPGPHSNARLPHACPIYFPCPLAQVGYVSILNLPMRRAEAKRKLEHTTAAFAQARARLRLGRTGVGARPRAAWLAAWAWPLLGGGLLHAGLQLQPALRGMQSPVCLWLEAGNCP